VRDLSAREAACCPFLSYTVTAHDSEVTRHVAGDQDPTVQAILDQFHQLPETEATDSLACCNDSTSLGSTSRQATTNTMTGTPTVKP